MAMPNVRLWFGFFGSVSFAIASLAIAEEPEVAEVPMPVVDVGFQFNRHGGIQPEEVVDRRVRGLELHLTSIVSSLDQTCDLTPQQKKKFRVAVKGAVEDLRNMMKPVGVNPKAEQRLVFGGPMVRIRMARDDGRRTAAELDAAISTIWQSAYDNILTAEQRAAYEKTLHSRADYRRRACASNSVARIDKHLLLSAKQRNQTEDHICQYLIKHDNFSLPGIANIAMVIAPIARDILSDAQQARLKEIQAGRFDDVSVIQDERIQQFQRVIPRVK